MAYEFINQTVLDVNVINMSLIIIERNYGAIDADYSTCHGYYIIGFSSSPYNPQEDLIIDFQVISSGETVYEGTYFSNKYEFLRKYNP